MPNTKKIRASKQLGNWGWSFVFLLIALFFIHSFWKNVTVPVGIGNPNGDHIRLTNLETSPVLKEGMHLYYIYKTEEEYPEWRLLEVSRLDIWTQGKIHSGHLDHIHVQKIDNNVDKENHFESLLAEKGRQNMIINGFDSVAKWQLSQAYWIIGALVLLLFSILMIIASIRRSKRTQANADYLLSQFPELAGDLQGMVEGATYADRDNGIYIYRHHLLTFDLTGVIDLNQVKVISGEAFKERVARHISVTKYRLNAYSQDRLKPAARFVFHIPGHHGQVGLLRLREYLLMTYSQMEDRDFEGFMD